MLLRSSPPPPPMQGSSFFRSAPGRLLSSSLCASVSRRISGSGIGARCCSGDSSSSSSVTPQSINPRLPPPPPPPSQQSSTSQLPDLAPLPSAARRERFRLLEQSVRRRDDGLVSHNERFRSVGSRSEPSRSSIPGKFSKYSKTISKLHTANAQPRAERVDKKAFRKPMGDIAAYPDRNLVSREESSLVDSSPAPAAVPRQKSSNSASPPVDKLPDWMQQYQFSYSEVPTAPIIGFRETPWSPFGPEDLLARPWTGSAPLKPTKKKRPEFDSFNPPPPGKKGVKYVQRPGPFPPGEGPKPAKSREEILGAPLTQKEIDELVKVVNKGSKQLNLGRDGLTHNMLDVVHSHWKRSVCCKIKCKGVPTIDMDNVARVVEEKTGGVIIHRAGGVIFLFRGRNYNYKDRPKIPIMLWKPPDPIYPRLIQAIPEGLTEEESKQLRAKGRKVAPLCKLAKNGVYLTLVADVKAQFKVDEVVRVDCEGMNPTDYKKIGAKLKDLVPCTLLSFEKEQIIMCRKRPMKVENAQPIVEEDKNVLNVPVDTSNSTGSTGLPVTEQFVPTSEGHDLELVFAEDANSGIEGSPVDATSDMDGNPTGVSFVKAENPEDEASVVDASRKGTASVLDENYRDESSDMDGKFEGAAAGIDRHAKHAASVTNVIAKDKDAVSATDSYARDATEATIGKRNTAISDTVMNTGDAVSGRDAATEGATMPREDDVDLLWQKAIDEGKALQLENQIGDPDVVFEKAAELSDVLKAIDSEDELAAKERLEKERIAEERKISAQVPPTSPFDVQPIGGLGVDELAKLLAP